MTQHAPAASPATPTRPTFNGASHRRSRTRRRSSAAPEHVHPGGWFKTTTHQGGKLIGFGDKQTSDSSSYDRHVYMDNAGTHLFGVNNGTRQTVSQPGTYYNDGQWHHVVGDPGRPA